MKNNKIVIPGSFDPITIGHLDIIKRSSEIFDQVTVLIMKNINKTGMFDYSIRKELIELCTKDLPNVKVDIYTGLLIDYLKSNSINIVVKGLRNSRDFDYELEMDLINRLLDKNIQTLYMISNSENLITSSSNVRELINYKADISAFVPSQILKIIKEITGYPDESFRIN